MPGHIPCITSANAYDQWYLVQRTPFRRGRSCRSYPPTVPRLTFHPSLGRSERRKQRGTAAKTAGAPLGNLLRLSSSGAILSDNFPAPSSRSVCWISACSLQSRPPSPSPPHSERSGPRSFISTTFPSQRLSTSYPSAFAHHTSRFHLRAWIAP